MWDPLPGCFGEILAGFLPSHCRVYGQCPEQTAGQVHGGPGLLGVCLELHAVDVAVSLAGNIPERCSRGSEHFGEGRWQ